jgi:hypothetical protein
MPEYVHLLVGAPLDWSQASVGCGETAALHGTWNRALVTCPVCRPTLRSPGAADAYTTWLHLPTTEERTP